MFICLYSMKPHFRDHLILSLFNIKCFGIIFSHQIREICFSHKHVTYSRQDKLIIARYLRQRRICFQPLLALWYSSLNKTTKKDIFVLFQCTACTDLKYIWNCTVHTYQCIVCTVPVNRVSTVAHMYQLLLFKLVWQPRPF